MEHDIQVYGNAGQHMKLQINSESLEFSGHSDLPKRILDKAEAENSMRMNTAQFIGPTFSVKLEKRILIRCSDDTYRSLEAWFGFDRLLRMEFRSGWILSSLFGAYLLYKVYTLVPTVGWTPWTIMTFFSGFAVLTTGTIGRFHPSRVLLLVHAAAWAILGIRSLYGLYFISQWSLYITLLFSIISVYSLSNRYIRLGRLFGAA